MTRVYTPIVESVPFSYTAETAPSTGELVTFDETAASFRAVRSSEAGCIYVGEPTGGEAS